jgi:oligopeptide transport system substrate-binding protein
MKARKLAALLAAALLGAALFVPQALAAGKNVLTFSMNYEVPGLDPQKANATPSFNVISHLFENLVRLKSGKVVPGVAERWEISPDGRTYTFHLRDSKWSDGKPVTAQDFEYGIRRLLDPKTASEYAFSGYYIRGAKDYNLGKLKDPSKVGVRAKDARTLVIELENPTSYFLGYLAFPSFAPARKDLVEKYGDKYAVEAANLIGNGPFTIKEWKHEQVLSLAKNPNYWNAGAVKLAGAEILQITDLNTAVSMFENGELDLVDIPPTQFKEWEKRPGTQIYLSGANDWMKVNMRPNPKKPWLTNRNFRKALAYAINREAYIALATKNLFYPNLRYVLPIVQGVKRDYGEEYPLTFYPKKGDEAKARDYLKKALSELKIKSPGEITVEYLIQDTEETRLMAETLQQQIGGVLGVKVKIRLVTRKQRLEDEARGNFDLVYAGWAPDYDDPMTYMEIWLSDSSQNNAKWKNAEFDRLIRGAMVEKDAKKRMDAIFGAEKILLDDAPMIPLQLRRKAWAVQPNVKGIYRGFIGPDTDFVFAEKK